MTFLVPVLIQTPAHSAIAGVLSYRHERQLPPGTLVRVPLGSREVMGVVWDGEAERPLESIELKSVAAAFDAIAPLGASWRGLVGFAARYYQRGAGEVALAALPPQLRGLDATQLERRLARKTPPPDAPSPDSASAPLPTAEQAEALSRIDAGPANGAFLLFGATGSGKTEVYLRSVQALLQKDAGAQALVMVPEINLTPQLEARFRARFGESAVVSLHSGMTNPQRLKSWLAAHSGVARIVLGTRMAVFASMPRLGLIVVDEEHDPSYKQQEGARYSARDLAVWRGHHEGVRVILGSATPSLESWYLSRPATPEDAGGRYTRLEMPLRVGAGALPRVRLVNMEQQTRGTVFAPVLLEAMRERIARGEQSLVLLNRRGYAPVLACNDCGWKSECPHCSAFRVFHKVDRTLRCHHCGFTQTVPRACPACGNLDIAPVGRGTERLEELLAERLADTLRPDGSPVRIARIDADTTRLRGALESQLAQVHSGDVDVLVGTQMIAKGHDFRRVTLVAAINPDGALFSADFRAPERLFSLLMQAGGRAGRDAAQGSVSEMWVQTFHPTHPLFATLRRHDYPAFAAEQIEERRTAGLPPWAAQALVRAEARSQDVAQGFLRAARAAAVEAGLETDGKVVGFDAVPMSLQRVANVERAQMLLESSGRAALQRFLTAWQPLLHAVRARPEHKGVIRWAVDVDPLAI